MYQSIVGSIFDYSFFTITSVSNTNLNSIQRIQNRAIRSIYSLPWDSPTVELANISSLPNVEDRLLQLGCKYICKNWVLNPFITILIVEYVSSRSSIQRSSQLATPLCKILFLIATAAVALTLN